jgi:hypothetical protein
VFKNSNSALNVLVGDTASLIRVGETEEVVNMTEVTCPGIYTFPASSMLEVNRTDFDHKPLK